jgi:hypothetical protein
VAKVSHTANGAIDLIVEMEAPPPPGTIRFVRGAPMVRLAGGGRRIVDVSGRLGSMDLTLQDAEGKNLPLNIMSSHFALRDNQMIQQYSLTFQPRIGQEKAGKLVYIGRKSMIIEVPFTLKDVPLP